MIHTYIYELFVHSMMYNTATDIFLERRNARIVARMRVVIFDAIVPRRLCNFHII